MDDKQTKFLVFNAYLVEEGNGYTLRDRKSNLPIRVVPRPDHTLSEELPKAIDHAVTLGTEYANDAYFRRDGESYLVIQGDGVVEKDGVYLIDNQNLVVARTSLADKNLHNEDQK